MINFISHYKGGVPPLWFSGESCGLQETQTKFCINFLSYDWINSSLVLLVLTSKLTRCHCFSFRIDIYHPFSFWKLLSSFLQEHSLERSVTFTVHKREVELSVHMWDVLTGNYSKGLGNWTQSSGPVWILQPLFCSCFHNSYTPAPRNSENHFEVYCYWIIDLTEIMDPMGEVISPYTSVTGTTRLDLCD